MTPLCCTFFRLSVFPRRGTVCRARLYLRLSLGFVAAAFRGGRFFTHTPTEAHP
jgi:hypothetical protein